MVGVHWSNGSHLGVFSGNVGVCSAIAQPDMSAPVSDLQRPHNIPVHNAAERPVEEEETGQISEVEAERLIIRQEPKDLNLAVDEHKTLKQQQ